jgi:hypothetical protein
MKKINPNTVSSRAKACGLHPQSVWRRIHAGMTVEDALTIPMRDASGAIGRRCQTAGVHRTTIYQRRYLYGMSLDEAFSHPPNGRCQCCGDKVKKFHADHNHTTNKFRGWLCQPCNLGLGAFMDDPRRLRKAVKYLLLKTDI